MPIYAYRCTECGHAKDVLQKLSDDPLRVCPACGAAAFAKQLTAAGFQLKGSGWYATDFRNSGSGAAKPAAPAETTSGADGGGGGGGGGSSEGGTAAATTTAAATPCGGSCACH